MACLVLLAAFLSLLQHFDSTQGFWNKDIRCKPRKTLVPIDAPYYYLYPFFVEVYRCSGGCSTFPPTTYQCVPTTWNNISGTVLDLRVQTTKTVVVQNHTSCDCACPQSANQCSEYEEWIKNKCSCSCKYPDGPPNPCSGKLSWSQLECKCICKDAARFCPIRQEWSHEACDCVCTRAAIETCKAENKFLNTTTCECGKSTTNPGVTGKRTGEGGLTATMLMVAMVVELLILLILFDLYLFWRYRKGVCSWIHTKCCSSSKETNRSQAKETSI